jgi:YbbR domain-containing protein
VVHNLKADDLKPQIDLKGLSPGRHRVEVSVELPPGVSLVRARPSKVTVTLAKAAQ